MEADEAVARGLASRVCQPDELLDDALTLAAELAALPTDAVVATKRLLLAARTDAVEAAMGRELAELGRLMKSRVGLT